MTETRTPRLALLCDRAGVIQKILCDDFFAAGTLLRGQAFAEWVDPGSRDKVSHLLAEVNAQGSAFDWELNVAPQGKVITLHFSGFANDASLLIVGDHNRNDILQLQEESMRINNELVNTLRAAIKDQTERNQAEEALRIAEAGLRSIFENAPVGIFQSTLQGQFSRVNPAMARIYGYDSAEDMVASVTNISRQIYVDASKRQEFQRSLAEHEEILEFISDNYRKDGAVIWTQSISRAVKDAQEDILFYEGFITDITERKRAEDALKSANEQLNLRIIEVENLQEELREQTIRDSQTGLYNRRYLDETLAREIVRAERENDPLSVIMSDIDLFKMINDTYGHQVGDQFLVEIASLMKNHARGSDIACRYGGEEFLLVLPGTTLDSAAKRAEEIRQKCAEIIIKHEGKDLRVTMSFGVATYPDHGKEAEEIIIKADKALYQSKQSGRNRVTVWDEEAGQ